LEKIINCIIRSKNSELQQKNYFWMDWTEMKWIELKIENILTELCKLVQKQVENYEEKN